jgi:hypothetical protein
LTFNIQIKNRLNIYFLQETHCNNETESTFQSDWGDKCIFSNKNSQSAGVMILFDSYFDYEIEDYIKEYHEDRWVEQQYTIYHMPIYFNT